MAVVKWLYNWKNTVCADNELLIENDLTFLSLTAYLEVGISTYLQEAVDHVPESGWTLVKPWSSTSRKGFFEASGDGESVFHDRFTTPEPGIYFVALNLLMGNAIDGFLKATLVINSGFEESNGIEGVYGNTTLEGTLSFSGFLRLYENDVLALYLHGSNGSILRDSTFSVMYMSRIGSVPGFHAVLSRDQVIQPKMKTRLQNWRISGTKGLFAMHSGISPSVGLFCAILEGIHKFTSNIKIESNDQSTRCLFVIVLNSNSTLVQKYSSGGRKYSTSLSALFYLYRGDCVELQIEAKSAEVLTIQLGSSFSGLFIGSKSDVSPQLSASSPTDNRVRSSGWNRVEKWTINISRRNFQSEDDMLTTNKSVFHSSTNGLFLVTAFINVNASHSLNRSRAHLLVSVTDAPTSLTGNSGLAAGKTLLTGPDSLGVSGVVELKKGDTVTVYFYRDVHDREITDGMFFVSMVSYDWPGVAATLKDNIALISSEWTKVTQWKAHSIPGLFSFDNAFVPTHGVYRIHLDGTYFVSCNVIFKGPARGKLSVMIAIDDVIDTGGGLFSVNENPKQDVTLNVAGSIKLRKNQNISVYVATTGSLAWKISMETGFSVVLVGAESLSTPGFFAGENN